MHTLVPLVLSFALVIYAFKSQNNNETYSIANRNLGVFALTATLVMTEFNTATLISFSSLAYSSGLKALGLPLIFLIGLLFYAVTVAKKWKEFNGLSAVDFFTHRYGKKVGTLATFFLFLAMAGFSATYLKSLTLLFENIFPNTNYWIMSAYIVLLTLFMVIRKGLVSIIKIDIIAFLIVILALPLILYHTYTQPHFNEIKTSANIFKDNELSTNFIISLIPLTMFSYILAPWYSQRLFSAKSIKVAYISVILSAILVFLFYASCVLISYFLALKGVVVHNAEQSFPYALDLSLKKYFHPLGYILLFLISSTTLTGVWNAMANITTELTKSIPFKNINSAKLLLCALITYILSNALVDNILNKMILANIPVISLSFALFAGFYWPRISLPGIYTSIAVGMLSGISAYFYFGDSGNYTFYWAFIGIPATFLSGFLAGWLFPAKNLKNQSFDLDIEGQHNTLS